MGAGLELWELCRVDGCRVFLVTQCHGDGIVFGQLDRWRGILSKAAGAQEDRSTGGDGKAAEELAA